MVPSTSPVPHTLSGPLVDDVRTRSQGLGEGTVRGRENERRCAGEEERFGTKAGRLGHGIRALRRRSGWTVGLTKVGRKDRRSGCVLSCKAFVRESCSGLGLCEGPLSCVFK